MEALVKNHNQVKMCRQCHRTKTLVNFINKTSTGICIICKTCRENQMKRYYGTSQQGDFIVDKKKKMKKMEEKNKYSLAEHPASLSLPSLSEDKAMSLYSYSQPALSPTNVLSPVSDYSPQPLDDLMVLPVPCQQWVPVHSTIPSASMGYPVYPAKLVFYPTIST